MDVDVVSVEPVRSLLAGEGMPERLNHESHEPLHVAYSFPTRLGVTGIGMTGWHQVSGLVELGVRVTLYCGSCERPIPGLHRLVETMNYHGVPIPYRVLGNDRAFRWHDAVVANHLERTADPVNVVHCWPLGAERTLTVARKRGIASCLERPNAHTAFAYEAVARESQRLGLPVPRKHTHAFNRKRLAREEREYRLADRLLCPSEFVAHTFRERDYPLQSIVRHQYGYDPHRFFPASDRQVRTNGAAHPALRFLYAGRCEPRKGLHFALEAWKRAGIGDQHELLIAGDFVPGYREYLGDLLAQPGVRHLGFVDDMPGLMRECDVFVLSSVEEGSALVTYEARGSGNVLLVSDSTGAICENGHDALVHGTADVEQLARQMQAMASSDDKLRRQLRERSLAGASELTWSVASRRLRQVYLDVQHDRAEHA
ncbi:MAG: glycosyltransferase family 4 protein [Phycisphaeraceae bacterium]